MTPGIEDFSIRVNHPYLTGVLIALNAIPDAFLVMEMNDCAFIRAQMIMGSHDINSTLLDCGGHHRIATTCTNIENITMDRSGVLEDNVRRIHAIDKCAAVLVSAFAISDMVGTQFDMIIRNLKKDLHKPIAFIPPKSLSGDWTDGYAESLASIANELDLSGGRPRDNKVGIVGYFMDRNEEDHYGNLRELERMLGAFNLELVSVWLSNSPASSLGDIRDAGTILSFPHARKAAEIAARKTGARLVETGLPFGLSGTRDWLLRIGEAFDDVKASKRFIDAEMREIVPRLEWIVPQVFLHNTVFFQGDVHFLEGVYNLALDLGCHVPMMVGMGKRSLLGNAPDFWNRDETTVLFNTSEYTLSQTMKSLIPTSSVSLYIRDDGNSFMTATSDTRLMVFGVPSFSSHALFDRPFLGFRGCLCFINQMADRFTGPG